MGEAAFPTPTTSGGQGPDVTAHVYAERTRLFYRQLVGATLASFTIAMLLAATLWVELGGSLSLGGWIAAMAAVQLSRLVLYALYKRAAPPVESARGWARLAVVTTAASGLCWGASVVLFFDAQSPTNLIVTAMAATGVAAGGVVTLSALPLAYAAYVTSHIPTLVVALAIAGGFANLVFAGGFVVFLAILYSAVRNMSATLEESLRLRFERAGIIETLDAALRYAESAGQAKSDFLSMITRELKSPLDTIIGHAALIDDLPGAAGSTKLQAYAGEIRRSARRLLALINDILDLLRADAGRLDLKESLFSLAETIERCRQLVQAHADNSRIDMTVAVEVGLPALRGDERLIRQALLNLLSNAVKFTPPDGRVRIGARRSPAGGVVLEVVDSGVGMSAKYLSKAMEPFGGADDGLRRERAGPGLGLPLAKRIIEQHGGRIEVVSQLGTGTTVRLVLPPERVAE